MVRPANSVWLLLAAMGCGDGAWAAARGLSLSHWEPLGLVGSGLVALMLYYKLSGRSARIAAMAEAMLQWIVFSVVGATLTYLAAMHAALPYDRQLSAVDAAFGLDWQTWFDLVNRHPAAKFILALAYSSLMPQILLAATWFAWRDRDDRSAELLATVIVALVLTTAGFWHFPALGPAAGIPHAMNDYLVDLQALRGGGALTFDVAQLKGIVTFPSFHAALAALFIYAYRRLPLFLPVAVLNTVMTVSIPSEGGHYFIDVFGGLAVAATAIAAVTALRVVRVGAARRAERAGVAEPHEARAVSEKKLPAIDSAALS